MELALGLVTGILFGILLQKSEILRYDRQMGALRLLDMTIFKFMLTAIIVGSIGIYWLKDMALIGLSLKTTSIGGQVFGGLVFGVGWGLLGYCPGTAGGALGEGRLDALWGIFGMIAGGGIYAVVYPWLKANILSIGNLGKMTVPGLLGINHWIVVLAFTVICLLAFRLFEENGL